MNKLAYMMSVKLYVGSYLNPYYSVTFVFDKLNKVWLMILIMNTYSHSIIRDELFLIMKKVIHILLFKVFFVPTCMYLEI